MSKYVIQILLCLYFFQSGCSVAVESYPYEPEVVELEGILEQEPKFGAPNYGESPETDERLNIYVLSLKQPIIVGTSDTLSELNDRPVVNVSKVQVAFLGGSKAIANKLVGDFVVLRGSLSKRIWGREFYPITFTVWSSQSVRTKSASLQNN